MASKNYKIGASFERRFVNDLLKSGDAIIANRFYGSKGICDVYWVERDGKYNEAQLKYSKNKPHISPKERDRVIEYASKFLQINVWIILKEYRRPAIWERVR